MPSAMAMIAPETSNWMQQALTAHNEGRLEFAQGVFHAIRLDGGINVGVSAQHFAEVERAAETWNDSLGTVVFRVVRDGDADLRVRTVSVLDGEDQGEVDTDLELLGAGHYRLTGDISICDQKGSQPITSKEFTAVVLHELGHVLGLDDCPNGNGAMADFDPTHLILHPSEAEVTLVKSIRAEMNALASQQSIGDPTRSV